MLHSRSIFRRQVKRPRQNVLMPLYCMAVHISFFLGALVRMLLDKEGTLDSHAQSLWEFDGTAYARTMKSQKTSGSSGFLTNMCSAHGEGVCVPSCFRFSATAIRHSRQISIFFCALQLGWCNRKFIPRRVLTGKVRGATRLD